MNTSEINPPQETVKDQKSEKAALRWWMPLVLTAFGIGFAALAVAIFLALFPQFRPGMIAFRVKQGDIFYHTPQWIKPPENPDEILSLHWLGWDQDGFRTPARRADTYPILALGDSFTEASNAAVPWPDVLAAQLNQPVRNLGFRGYGPVEEARILELYGAGSGAQTVILGYFEGNDLSNAVSADEAAIELPSEIESFEIIETDLSEVKDRDERYPMPIAINGQQHDIVFFEGYLWWLNGTKRTFARSRNLEITAQSWQRMRAAVPDACFIVAYFPSKPHIYLPYLLPEYQAAVMREAKLTRGESGKNLEQVFTPTPYNKFVERLDNQRNAVAERAAQDNIVFFDLTPVLQTAAAQGEILYYTYDTHWNQRGHDLVGQAIADFLAADPCQE